MFFAFCVYASVFLQIFILNKVRGVSELLFQYHEQIHQWINKEISNSSKSFSTFKVF